MSSTLTRSVRSVSSASSSVASCVMASVSTSDDELYTVSQSQASRRIARQASVNATSVPSSSTVEAAMVAVSRLELARAAI